MALEMGLWRADGDKLSRITPTAVGPSSRRWRTKLSVWGSPNGQRVGSGVVYFAPDRLFPSPGPWWADANNKPIQDLTAFTRAFFAKLATFFERFFGLSSSEGQ